MYKGYLGYGDEPLVNLARLAKYAGEGAIPRDVDLVLPEVSDFDDLAAALGEDPYRTPLLDGAPWYDATNPDSAYFAGLLPIEVTGLDGSTRTRTVTEGLADGGTANRGRATTKTIAVSAYALGASQAALDAGLSWLAGALHPPCADAGTACGGTRLDLFSSAPTYCDELPDLDADPITSLLISGPLEASGPTLAYVDVEGGGLLDPACGEVTVTAVVSIGTTATGEDLTGRTVVLSLVDSTGNPYALTGPVILPVDKSSVTLTLTVEPSPGFPAQWQPVLSWYGPAILDGGDSTPLHDLVFSVDAGGSVPLPDIYDGGDSDGPWSVGPAYGGNLTVTSWTYTRQPFLTAAACLTSLRRSYRKVVTIDGPTVVEELTGDDGAPFGARVEWTWSATDPIIYGDTTDIFDGLIVGRTTSSTHDAARVASTTDVALFVPVTATGNIDGVLYFNTAPLRAPVLQPGDRVLLKNQTNPTENGLWIYNGRGAFFTRAPDMDTWAEVVAAEVYVTAGITQASTTWHTTSTGGGTLETTPIVWAAGSSGGPAFYDNGVTFRATGLQIADNADVAGTDTTCPIPAPSLVLCGTDPDLPDLTSPPAPPTLPDPGMPTVTTYTRRAIQIPPDLSPQPGGTLTIVVRNLDGIAYRGIRLRLWADADPDFGVADECGFQSETFLTYLAGGQTVTIDGPEHTVTTTCDTGIDSDHEPSMRGPYGGPFTFPELTCGSRYHLTIDVPVTADAGGVSVDLSVTRRGV